MYLADNSANIQKQGRSAKMESKYEYGAAYTLKNEV